MTEPELDEGLRRPSEDEIDDTIRKHERWLATGGEEGERADLSEDDLRRRDLSGENLAFADLSSSDLYDANLSGADLRGATLEKALLVEAELKDADLTEANLQSANLRNTDLEHTTGLQSGMIAQANVSNADLPSDVEAFEGLDRVREASQYARRLFSILLAACAYSLLTIATTTDAELITNRATSSLPVIGTTIPIVGFYWATPLALFVLYVYFHFQLQRLWEELATLPSVFPDGKDLDKKADPWLLLGLTRNYVSFLKDEHLPFFSFQKLTVAAVAWWAVPALIALFGYRYLPKHHLPGTIFHVVLTITSAVLAVSFYRNAAATLQGKKREPFQWQNALKDSRSAAILALIISGIASVVLLSSSMSSGHFAADLEDADMQNSDIKWARLEGANLRNAQLQSSDASGADLTGAVLISAEIDSAVLEKANLIGANLQDASLQHSILTGAQMKSATLESADLDNAVLRDAKLTGANLNRASLHGSQLARVRLDTAEMAGSHLDSAQAEDSQMPGVNLAGSTLRGANLAFAILDTADLENADLSGARLKGTRLFDATLRRADLSGANLAVSDLRKAYLNEAHLPQAVLAGANLKDAVFLSAVLRGADFYGSPQINDDVRRSHLRRVAEGRRGVRHPSDLNIDSVSASMYNAYFHHADLRDIDVRVDSLCQVLTLDDAELDDSTLTSVCTSCSDPPFSTVEYRCGPSSR